MAFWLSTMTLFATQLQESLFALSKYYGINQDLLPPGYVNESEGGITVCSGCDLVGLGDKLSFLCDGKLHDELMAIFGVLVDCLLKSPALQAGPSSEELSVRSRRDDYLRLFRFASSIRGDEPLFLRDTYRTVRLSNSSNWFVEDLLEPFLLDKLSDLENIEEALRVLDTPKPTRKGRRPNDARIPVLLWGTYRLITDKISFRTPMPNNLCSFLVTLLQVSRVVPSSTVIDIYWVRAQLRYISSRSQKPAFPIRD